MIGNVLTKSNLSYTNLRAPTLPEPTSRKTDIEDTYIYNKTIVHNFYISKIIGVLCLIFMIFIGIRFNIIAKKYLINSSVSIDNDMVSESLEDSNKFDDAHNISKMQPYDIINRKTIKSKKHLSYDAIMYGVYGDDRRNGMIVGNIVLGY